MHASEHLNEKAIHRLESFYWAFILCSFQIKPFFANQRKLERRKLHCFFWCNRYDLSAHWGAPQSKNMLLLTRFQSLSIIISLLSHYHYCTSTVLIAKKMTLGQLRHDNDQRSSTPLTFIALFFLQCSWSTSIANEPITILALTINLNIFYDFFCWNFPIYVACTKFTSRIILELEVLMSLYSFIGLRAMQFVGKK